ncbi:hypothetical protein [Pseudarthrobacter sp. BIM B-2242]|uniref:hypothetical protein n=1 Tax=Pseudarthrobacter sp. BIM B-2242 TaxID=2772401 RepID=UPI00168B7D8B|nr:hypothetical protein [Pseudarthrobacter sp. BIM B-2242]QOD05722.1 hypothetical protein IDT60_22025 [Pseudarthrobacter sp. BIM B-2242]
MNTKIFRSLGAAALIASILLGSSACSSSQNTPAAEPTATATVASEDASNAAVATAIKDFFATATSEEIGAAFPDKASEETFKPVLDKIDIDAPAAPLKKAVTDLALLKVSDPKAELAVTVDDSAVSIDGTSASVPASAVSITSGGTKVANSDELAAEINQLVYRDGSWLITFPQAPAASPSASDTASATPSPSASN